MKKTAWCFMILALLCCIIINGCDRNALNTSPSSEDLTDNDSTRKTNLLVHFYDVPETEDKWGDCTYIEFPNGENMLIDIGVKGAGEWITKDLVSQGITHIDYLVFSHFHADHVNGYSALIKEISVGQVYSTGYITKQFQWVLDDIKDRNIPHTVLTAGDSFTVGDVVVDVLWPTRDLVSEMPTLDANDNNCIIDTNNRSFLLRFSYIKNRLLMTSDLFIEAQNDILEMYDADELKADVMKVPHHGYDNAINRKFIEALTPKYAVMMGNHVMTRVGYNRYASVGCKTFATWMNGDVWVSFDGENIEVWADNEEIHKYYQ
jgi:competence protein ComEC